MTIHKTLYTIYVDPSTASCCFVTKDFDWYHRCVSHRLLLVVIGVPLPAHLMAAPDGATPRGSGPASHSRPTGMPQIEHSFHRRLFIMVGLMAYRSS
jgi:hypothetical protein